jgi:AcrR family transcriptional regulator
MTRTVTGLLPSEIKREESRKLIQRAALELFCAKGYEATTMRDIIARTGLLNGSIYNRFKSKDAILLSMINEAVSDTLKESNTLLRNDGDPIKALVLPMYLELYMAYNSENLAELIFQAHRSWEAVETYSTMYRDWLKSVWSEHFHQQIDEESFRIGLISILGALGNICGSYAHGYRKDCRIIMEDLIKTASILVGIPVFEVRRTVDELDEYIRGKDIVICGYSLADLQNLSSENRS